MRDDLASALFILHSYGIKVDVIYWPLDPVTPYPWGSWLTPTIAKFAMLHELTPVDLSLPANITDDSACALAIHLEFCIHPEVTKKVLELLEDL